MGVYFSSDWHFGHRRIQEFQPNRKQGTVDDHDNWIIDQINATCGEGDTVYALGDNALGEKERWRGLFARIRPHIKFIVGNHDPQFPANKPRYIEKYSQYYEGYEVLGLEAVIELAGRKVRLSHFPYKGDHFDEDRYELYRPADDGMVLVHGHVHGSGIISHSPAGTLQIHVGMDAWGRPVSEYEIEGLIKEFG